ncbi:DUF226 domain-containing protein (plasmid) [Borrelia coriaceae]|uniref:Putative cytosolic protein n=1 Tax=Borrelia coriaceae ATCC 43381 TaxID=1408429 RepID=W5SY34_9SPIR|nr:DUF226 domain-containing protein [Borrelia coriaceae]AHH11782.1 Putative cytosolic protein [Borrelia coriaceae ATCC 43381]UPA16778.1 DUF226 domain-containing protein [Borrelia coriaceae]
MRYKINIINSKKLEEKKLKIKKFEENQKKSKLFVLIDKKNDKTFYHTRIMLDFYTFGINETQNDKFYIILRSWYRDKKQLFHLFTLRDGDKFLGIYYGHRKPIKNIISKYQENGEVKKYSFSKAYYIEFRFKKGSVFCYIQGIYYLTRSEKMKTKYCQTLISLLKKLEGQIYEFYGRKLPDGGLITKWIEKNQK